MTSSSKSIIQSEHGKSWVKQILKTTWMHSSYVEAWLLDFVKDGACLNVCCGKSLVGNVRLDISLDSTSTEYGDLFKIEYPESSFDYVYCDPPFNYYVVGTNRFKWQQKLFKFCRKALITKRPKTTVNLHSKEHYYIVAEDTKPSLALLRIDLK